MNKKRVNEWINSAKTALEQCEIVSDEKIESGYRGQISSFGASVIMGSFKSAVAFFSEQGNSAVKRNNLISAMYFVITGEKKDAKDIFEIVCKKEGSELKELEEKFIDASISLKLAMNFFEMK